MAQSFASARYARVGGPVKTEDDPLDPTPVAAMRESEAAMRHLDEAVTEAGGIVLRYGGFYGADNDGLVGPVRKRQFPIVGDGGGVSSFIHLDDAAAATVLALERGRPGLYNVVDDDPAPVREWLPVLARVLEAKPPRRFPRWLARLFAGDAAVMMGTESRGASNAKAKRELGWQLRYPKAGVRGSRRRTRASGTCWELLDDPARDHVRHVEDVADVGRVGGRARGVVALELVDRLSARSPG